MGKWEKRAFQRFLRSERGNAAIMVLSVILILTAFGTVSLFASLANVKMGNRYRFWSQDFYVADSSAEEKVAAVDALLRDAEEQAGKYMKSGAYDYAADEMPAAFLGLMSADAQDFFYANRWPYESFEAALDDPDAVWGPEDDQGYQDAMLEHNTLMYERVYYYLANRMLADAAADPDFGIAYEPVSAYDDLDDPTSSIGWYSTGLDYENTFGAVPPPGHLGPKIKLEGRQADRRVTAVLAVRQPKAEAVVQTILNPVYGNPLWGYALAAEGQISFSGSPTICGDVYASGSSGSGAGINISGDVDIYGNVYANADIVAMGSGKLHVHNEGALHVPLYGKRQKIYADSGYPMTFCDLSVFSWPGTSPLALMGGALPLLYDDTVYGNVYCSDLKVDEGADGAVIALDGHLITTDDIELNGKNSTIVVNGNFVGLNSEANFSTDGPNASSSVINNQPKDESGRVSKITLSGRMIVPGVAYGEYADGPGADSFSQYYRTVESVTAKLNEILLAYLYPEEGDPEASYGPPAIYTASDGTEYFLKDAQFASDDGRIADFLSALEGNPESKINVGPLEGYTLGLVVSDGGPSGVIRGANEHYTRYMLGREPLLGVFNAKTRGFGFNNGWTMADMVSKSAAPSGGKVTYISGPGSIEIDDDMDDMYGIIYCTGDLELSGSGTFRGVILCEGDISVSGSPHIYYDEGVVDGIMSAPGNRAERAFFAPGCDYVKNKGGKTYTYYEDYDTTSGVREMKRYRIESWIEGNG
ncbi:MAG: hypothetical protein GXX99_03290 [Clostridiales bacterium]|nr:hypothetical protein [Clostridiales bacterium]